MFRHPYIGDSYQKNVPFCLIKFNFIYFHYSWLTKNSILGIGNHKPGTSIINIPAPTICSIFCPDVCLGNRFLSCFDTPPVFWFDIFLFWDYICPRRLQNAVLDMDKRGYHRFIPPIIVTNGSSLLCIPTIYHTAWTGNGKRINNK